MVNYSLKCSVADVARILRVEKKLVKDWAYFFAEYMSMTATPKKGEVREFQLEDIRVMAYVFTLWEDEPDMENIKYGLNTNSHYQSDSIDSLIVELTPIF